MLLILLVDFFMIIFWSVLTILSGESIFISFYLDNNFRIFYKFYVCNSYRKYYIHGMLKIYINFLKCIMKGSMHNSYFRYMMFLFAVLINSNLFSMSDDWNRKVFFKASNIILWIFWLKALVVLGIHFRQHLYCE